MLDRKSAGLPEYGDTWENIERELASFREKDFDWKTGKLPSYTYFYTEEAMTVQKLAYSMFIGENGLGAGRAFPSLAQMQSDIFEMCLPLFNAPVAAGASFTSGGTESVFMAVKTARDSARHNRGEQRGKYNIVTSYAAHLCLDKAAHLLDIEIRRTPLGLDHRADPSAIEQAIDDQTIMVYSSAPSYPFGLFDPIEKLAEIALKHNLWLHVDACWGGFISPFAKQLGYPIPAWNFEVDGVTSISADLHKFGYTAKGSSLLIYADKALQQFEKFECADWPRGTYATPTFMGSKAAGAVASTWAVLKFMGRDGYLKATKMTMEATDRLISGINAIEGLRCLRQPLEGNLFVFIATDPMIDIMAVADRLEQNGWMRGRMREPLGIHQGVNPAHLASSDEYITAIKEAVAYVKSKSSPVATAYDEHSY